MTDYSKVLTYFVSVLIVSNRCIDAIKVIEKFGYKNKIDRLALANMHKLHSVVLLKNNSIEFAIDHINEAIQLFETLKSSKGSDLWFSFSEYLESKIDEFDLIDSQVFSDKEK